MNTNPVLKTLRRSWWVMAVFALLGLGVAQAVVAGSPTLYSATDTLYVSANTKAGDSATSAYEGNLLSQDRVKSYKELLGSGMIAGYVADRLGGGLTAAQLQAATEVANQPETVLLTVTVTDPSPIRAAVIANAYGDVFSESVHTLERPSDPAAQPSVTVRTAFPATPYPIPISPRPGVALPVGLLLGLIAGVAVAVLRRRLDDRVDDSRALAGLVGTRDLGSVRETDPSGAPDPDIADDVRRLRGALRHAAPAERPAVVLITGAGRSEGRTTTAVELARALAETGDRVLLLEADLRRPSLATRLGLDGGDGSGLVSVLSGRLPTSEVVRHHGPGLDVVVAGEVSTADRERLSSSLLPAVIAQLAAPYDWVVVDSPPLTAAPDASILAPLATGVLVLARHGRTSARELTPAVEDLRGVGATILGTTLVGRPARENRRDRILRALSVPPPGARAMPRPAAVEQEAVVTTTPAHDEAEGADPTPTREPALTRTSNGTSPAGPEAGERSP